MTLLLTDVLSNYVSTFGGLSDFDFFNFELVVSRVAINALSKFSIFIFIIIPVLYGNSNYL